MGSSVSGTEGRRGMKLLSIWQRRKSLFLLKKCGDRREQNQAKQEPDSLELLESAGCVQPCFSPFVDTLWVLFVTKPPSAESLTAVLVCTSASALVFQIYCVCHVSASFSLGSAAACPILFSFCSLKWEAEKLWLVGIVVLPWYHTLTSCDMVCLLFVFFFFNGWCARINVRPLLSQHHCFCSVWTHGYHCSGSTVALLAELQLWPVLHYSSGALTGCKSLCPIIYSCLFVGFCLFVAFKYCSSSSSVLTPITFLREMLLWES